MISQGKDREKKKKRFIYQLLVKNSAREAPQDVLDHLSLFASLAFPERGSHRLRTSCSSPAAGVLPTRPRPSRLRGKHGAKDRRLLRFGHVVFPPFIDGVNETSGRHGPQNVLCPIHDPKRWQEWLGGRSKRCSDCRRRAWKSEHLEKVVIFVLVLVGEVGLEHK